MLLGERDALIVDERRVLDGGDARADRILDAFGRMRVGRDAQAEIVRLVDGRAQLLGRELDGFRIAPMGEHRARGQYLDVIGAAVRKFPDLLPHLPGAVGNAELQVPGQLDVRATSRSSRPRPR